MQRSFRGDNSSSVNPVPSKLHLGEDICAANAHADYSIVAQSSVTFNWVMAIPCSCAWLDHDYEAGLQLVVKKFEQAMYMKWRAGIQS